MATWSDTFKNWKTYAIIVPATVGTAVAGYFANSFFDTDKAVADEFKNKSKIEIISGGQDSDALLKEMMSYKPKQNDEVTTKSYDNPSTVTTTVQPTIARMDNSSGTMTMYKVNTEGGVFVGNNASYNVNKSNTNSNIAGNGGSVFSFNVTTQPNDNATTPSIKLENRL